MVSLAGMTLQSTKTAVLGAVVMLTLAGCGGGSEETSAAGRNATVEFRPVMLTGGNAMQKQRSGKLVKVTGDWVIVNENGTEIWVPKDMVLEIRMGT